jgi:hypothetical protein
MIDYFPKLIELDDLSPEGEPTIQIVRMGEYNHLHHVKTASEAFDYIKHVKPIPGKTVILVLAMTAGEFYGPNRNGDAWPERPLRVGNSIIGPDAVLPKHYKTFETDANVFKHHINKNPDKRIGRVLRAFYNWNMHRVELLLALDNRMAEDIVQRIDQDEFPAVSMGCRVKHDTCSICGNEAPSRRQYCDHARFQLGVLLPNGKRIFVWNPNPKFFDISMVRRPADKHGFMMKKVAESVPEIRSSAILGEYIDTAQRKSAALGKLSVIDKIIKGTPIAAKEDTGDLHSMEEFGSQIAKPVAEKMPPLDENVLRHLLRYDPAESMATLASMGIFLTTPEFMQFFARAMDPNLNLPDDVLDRSVATQGKVANLLAHNPHIVDEIAGMGFLPNLDTVPNEELAKKAEILLEKRSQIQEYLYRHLVPEAFKPYPTRGKQDLIDVKDPQTGRTYQTTRLARERATDAAAEQRLKSIAGGGALLAGAGGLLMSPAAGARFLAPAGYGTAYLGQGLRGYPSAMGSTGERVYTEGPGFKGTELVEKRSSFGRLDLQNAMIKIALDHAHRPGAQFVQFDPRPFDMEFASFESAALHVGNVLCP